MQREMDEYIMSQNQGRIDYGLNNSYMKSAGSHITQTLKVQVKELRSELKKKEEETTKIKRSLKATNIQELEVEMKLYVDEWTRLRHMLEESYKNSMDPAEMARLQEQFQIQENYIANLQSENQELAETCAKMQQIMQSQQEDKEVESKLRSKLNRIILNKKKLSKSLKTKERELKQLRTDLAAARVTTKGSAPASKALSDKLAKCQRDLEDKAQQASRLKRECDDKDARIRQLQQEVAELRASPHSAPQSQPAAKVRPTTAKAPPRKEPAQEPRKQSDEESKDEVDEQYPDEYPDESPDEDRDDEARESPVPEDDGQVDEVANKDEEARGEQKAIIGESEVDPLFDKLKLLLQRNKIKYSSMGQLLPSEVTIMKLEHRLKSLGLKDAEERLTLCRYIIEPRSEKKVEFNENREVSREKAENVLKSKIESYKTYENDEDEMRDRVKKQVGRFISTLKDALECEDLDGTGYIPASTLKSCFHAMDINLDDDLIEFLIYVSGSLDKVGSTSHLMLEYNKITELVESSGEDALSKKAEELLNEDNYSDDYGNDFDEPKEEKDEEESQEIQPLSKAPLETEPQQMTGEEGEGEGEGDLDEEIDDEQMISIAENCLIRIAEELLDKKLTIRQLFKGDIIEEEIEGEKIELLFPTSFLDGIQRLGITEFSDLENAWLMNVLAKPQLENTILLDELIDIMENLGIPEGELSPQTNKAADAFKANPEPAQQQNKQQKKKGLNLEDLSDDAKTLLLNFVIYLEQESMTAANFFESVKYEQMVKTKKKQSSVDIVPAEDFFRLIEDTYEIVADVNLTEDVKGELQDLLWLEANYKDLLFLKKIEKALKEIKNAADFQLDESGGM